MWAMKGLRIELTDVNNGHWMRRMSSPPATAPSTAKPLPAFLMLDSQILTPALEKILDESKRLESWDSFGPEDAIF